MRQIWIALFLVSCGKPTPVTSIIGRLDFTSWHLFEICEDTSSTFRSILGSLPQNYQELDRVDCSLALDPQRKRRQGIVPIQLQSGSVSWFGTCGVRIGPAEILGTVPPTVIAGFVQAPELRQLVLDKIGVFDESREYSLQTSTNGLQIDLRQSISHVDGQLRHVIDLSINGCAQFADTEPEVRRSGKLMTSTDP